MDEGKKNNTMDCNFYLNLRKNPITSELKNNQKQNNFDSGEHLTIRGLVTH